MLFHVESLKFRLNSKKRTDNAPPFLILENDEKDLAASEGDRTNLV